MDVFVDYLTVTFPKGSEMAARMRDVWRDSHFWDWLGLAPVERNITGFAGWVARSEEHGHMFFGTRAYDGYSMLQASGYFSHVWAMLLAFTVQSEDMNVSRIDLQYTGVLEQSSTADPEIFIKAAHVLTLSYVKDGHFGSPYKVTMISSSQGGSTLYIGSRSSEWMLRVYNKGAQAGWNVRAVRYEAEVKGDKATHVWGAIKNAARAFVPIRAREGSLSRALARPVVALAQSFVDALDGQLDDIASLTLENTLDNFFVARGINLSGVRGAAWGGHVPLSAARPVEGGTWKDASMVWLQRQVTNTVKRLVAAGLDAHVRTWFEDAYADGVHQSFRDDDSDSMGLDDINMGPFRDSFNM